MSKLQTEILAATGLKAIRNEDRQECIARMMKGISALDDAGWEGLSKGAQDWFNDAADAKNAKKKTLPDLPDLDADEPADEPKTSRRGSTKTEDAPKGVKPTVGVIAKVTTKRGKSATGKIVEIDEELIVLKMGDGSEQEFARDRVESIEVAGGEAAEAEAADPIKVGAEVVVLTKRGKEVTGKIVELDDEVIVIDTGDKDEELSRDRVESIMLAGTHAKEEPKATSRRGSSKEEAEPETKTKRSSNEGGVSIGTRIKELIADDLEATQADIAKALKKEGIEFKDNTLNLNYVDAHKFVTILKAKKMLK